MMGVLSEIIETEFDAVGNRRDITLHVIEVIWHAGWNTDTNGQMRIILERFFPCTQKDLKKFLKVVDLDLLHADEIRDELAKYFKAQVESAKEDIRFYKSVNSKHGQKKFKEAEKLKSQFQKYIEIMVKR